MRRSLLGLLGSGLLCGALLCAGLPGLAHAQAYPSQPIKLIVPYAAGGVTDMTGRLAAEHIKNKTGQSVVVENRAGAGGNAGIGQVVTAPPDGYTLGLVAVSNVNMNQFLYKSMPFDPIKDLAHIAAIGDAPQIMVISAKVPAQNLAGFIAWAKANPDQANYGSAGTGSTVHLAADQITRQAGIAVKHVSYRGAGPAVTDLVSGNVQMMVVAAALVVEHAKAGSLRIVASASAKRLPFLPDVPTTSEAGLPVYDTANWFGLVGPKDLPKAIVDQLNAIVVSMGDDADIRKRFDANYIVPMKLSADQFSAMIKADLPKWEKIIKAAGIEPQ